MIPVSTATLKQINRFPELYKRQALQAIRHEVEDTIRVTADSFVMASILALIEEFGFGTAEGSTRVKRYIAKPKRSSTPMRITMTPPWRRVCTTDLPR